MSDQPTDDLRDFGDPDVPTDANPSRLRHLILAQHDAPGGAAVALFTSATLTEAAAADHDGPLDAAGPGPVPEVAVELGVDPDELRLFSFDAYVVQSALGEQWLSPR